MAELYSPPFPDKVQDYDVLRSLGRGQFGEVEKVREKGDQQRVFAMKRIKLASLDSAKHSAQVNREVEILYSLQHPHIIRLYFDFEHDGMLFLGMEFAAGGNLHNRLHEEGGSFEIKQAARYFRETCEALDYMHHLPEKVIHRDIKPENLMLDCNDTLKLGDFGWANIQVDIDVRETFCGTLEFLAPEMVMGKGHNEAVDMWSTGVVLFEFLTGLSPFGAEKVEVTCRKILSEDIRYPEDVDDDARDLISKLCEKKPQQRLDVRGALAHGFLAKYSTGA